MEAHKVLRDTVIRLEVGERPFCPSSRSPSPSPALTHHSLSPSPSSTPTATLQRPPERAGVRRGWDPGGGRGGLHEGEGLQAMVHIYMCVCVYIACIYRLVHMYILYIHTCWYIYTYIYIWHIDIPGLPSSTGNSSVPSSTDGQQHGEPSGAHIFVRDCRLSQTYAPRRRTLDSREREEEEGKEWKKRGRIFLLLLHNFHVSIGNGASRESH